MPSSDRITSPEQLNDYIHVTAPGAWIILSAILLFLAGFMFWILAGSLEVSFSSYVYTEGGSSVAFVAPENASKLKEGMTVRIADSGLHGTVEHVDGTVTPYSEIVGIVGETNALLMGINEGDKLIKAVAHIGNAPAKISRAVFITDTVRPVSFLLK